MAWQFHASLGMAAAIVPIRRDITKIAQKVAAILKTD